MKRLLMIFPLLISCVIGLSQEQKPNIIFIFADDWGYGDLGCHGSTFCKTPVLDKMVDEGIDFQNFSVANPVCSPSRTAVMTGQFPSKYNIHGHFSSIKTNKKREMPDWLNPKAPMLTRMMKKAGYVTGHFGKWHLTNSAISDAPLPYQYGIDEYGAFNISGKQMDVEQTIPMTLDFIKQHQSHPFYINVWIHAAHTPHYPKNKYLDEFSYLDEQKKVYASVITDADKQIGNIFSLLKELGIDKNTLVVFSSDNGPEKTTKRRKINDASTGPGLGSFYSVGETGGLKGRKRSLYAGGVRVPFIVRWPGKVPAGIRNNTTSITAVDLLPTFIELAGATPPKNYHGDGQSIVTALKGNPFERTKTIYWEWRLWKDNSPNWPNLGIQEGKWKLLINTDLKRSELYCIQDDWAEQKEMSKEYPKVVQTLLNKALVWKMKLPKKSEIPQSCISTERMK
ncbi:sulfatase-like hydrolase/transferase [Halosquirtibacter xylanolyticus]|uniref:sulfatase family protein n=1 Tax=Halosquirtibacter xylanolyticus TaxID=3374599 RepID=UPI00374A7B04|nr:sulfatase-like hydrolase/transferase [Prolixibacteraceae bacterium]